jgi:hypothetical protein
VQEQFLPLKVHKSRYLRKMARFPQDADESKVAEKKDWK